MDWLHTHTQEHPHTPLASRAEVQAAFDDHKEGLYWIALMITGNPELAEQSVVDAASLAETKSYGFRVWLVHWAHSATARVSVNAVRSFIQEAAAQYLDWTCSHRRREPLSPAEAETLHDLDANGVIERLDVLARAVLVLYGCEGASFPECALVLGVPLRCVIGAYCRALQFYSEFAEATGKTQQPHSPHLYFIRYDPDGVPVWGSESPRAA